MIAQSVRQTVGVFRVVGALLLVCFSSAGHGQSLEAPLSTLASLPKSSEISELQLVPFMNRESLLSPERFKALLDTARIVDKDAKMLRQWHYAPWYRGSFKTHQGRYCFQLFMGGLGLLEDPEGRVGAFTFKD